jgi:hypothetical protein
MVYIVKGTVCPVGTSIFRMEANEYLVIGRDTLAPSSTTTRTGEEVQKSSSIGRYSSNDFHNILFGFYTLVR